MVNFAHAYVRRGVRERYELTPERQRSTHHALGLWWSEQPPSVRMGLGVNLHLYRAEAWDDLERCLIDVGVGGAILQGVPTQDLFLSWSSVAEARRESSAGQYLERAMGKAWREWKVAEGDRATQLIIAGRLTDLLSTAEAFDLGLEVSRHGLELARAIHAETKTPESWLFVITSLGRIADNERQRGDLDAARAKYNECLAISLALGEDAPRGWDVRCMTALVLERLGDIEGEANDRGAALERYQDCLAIRRTLLEELKTPQSRRDFCVTLGRIADNERQRGDLDAAMVKYNECLEIHRALLEELKTPQSRRDVSAILSNIADIDVRRGDLDAAMAKFNECLGIVRALWEELKTPESQRDVSVIVGRIADIEVRRGGQA